MSFDLFAVIRPEVAALRGYHVPPGCVPVKLDANESPIPLGGEELASEIAKALAEVALHRYPDPEGQAVRELLARDLEVTPGQVVVTNGSDEAIQLLSIVVAAPGATVAAPVPTFVMYELAARMLGLRFVGVPLSDQFDLDVRRFCDALGAERPRLVFVAWPNNPTGRLYDPSAVEEIVRICCGGEVNALVVVDEAYFHYSGRSFLSKLGQYPNLVILRTLSKIGLAAIRLGVLVANTPVVEQINTIRPPYNVNALSQAVVRIVLKYPEAVRRHAAAIVQERDRLLARLQDLPGMTTYPTQANFFLMRTARSGDEVFQGLLERGVLVRNFSHAPYLANCLRVTVGTAEENDAFLTALPDILLRGR
ncbi:MAG TPA: histidinol-phosphate transaminase [Candidatus Methylomirabilis sp.]|nr:histidinol-phosphate transaminase [Candidatus Methylomirabilis sp.]